MTKVTAFDAAFDKIDNPAALLGTIEHFNELLLEKAIKMKDNLSKELEDKQIQLDKLKKYIKQQEDLGVQLPKQEERIPNTPPPDIKPQSNIEPPKSQETI